MKKSEELTLTQTRPVTSGEAEELNCQKDQYVSAMRGAMLSNNFGIEMPVEGKAKGIPVHCNGRTNPRPKIKHILSDGRLIVIRKESTCSPAVKADHLSGERAYFYKAKAKHGDNSMRTSMHAIDVDIEGNVPYESALQFAQEVFQELFPKAVPFYEPSRSYDGETGCGGAYGWFKVKWDTDHPIVRKEYLNALGRYIKARFEPRDGIVFDAVKGTFSFQYDNPKYDPVLAMKTSHKARRVDWVEFYDGTRWVRLPLKDLDESDIPFNSIISKEYIEMTELEAYEKHKRFYGIDYETQTVDWGAKFPYRTELEEVVWHQGILITAPCYKAHSGERPNNIPQFVEWKRNKSARGVIKEREIYQLLAEKDKKRIDKLKAKCDAEAMGVKYKPDQVSVNKQWEQREECYDISEMDVNCFEGTEPANGWSQKIKSEYGENGYTLTFLDSSAGQFDRYRAASGMVVNKRGKSDVAAIEQEVLKLVELPCGPATGPRNSRREDQVRREVQWAIDTFEYGNGDFIKSWFNDDDLAELEKFVRSRISDEDIADAVAIKPKARIDYTKI